MVMTLAMLSKFLINLENIPYEGEDFEFKADAINENTNLKEISLKDSSNMVQFKVQPIDSFHYSVKGLINLIQPLNCSRCGEDVNKPIKITIDDFLSTQVETEGEDQGFFLIKSNDWDASEFIRELVVLDTPVQVYKYGEKCLKSCPHYNNAVEKGWLSKAEEKTNPFAELEKLKGKLQ